MFVRYKLTLRYNLIWFSGREIKFHKKIEYEIRWKYICFDILLYCICLLALNFKIRYSNSMCCHPLKIKYEQIIIYLDWLENRYITFDVSYCFNKLNMIYQNKYFIIFITCPTQQKRISINKLSLLIFKNNR